MIPLMSLIASATATVGVLTMCSSKDRQTSRKKPTGKSSKSKRAESKSSRASSSTAGTKSHRSSRSGKSGKSGKKSGKSGKSGHRKNKHRKSSKSKKDPKKGSQKESQKESSVEAAVAAIPGAGKRQSETKKTRSERSSKSSRRSSKSKKCKAVQCDPNKLKNQKQRNAICPSNSSDASSKSGKRSRKQKSSGSGSHSGEKALKAVPNSSNYKFPEGQIKPSTLRATPNKLPFAPTGGVQTVVIPNSTKSRKAFKVKTSDNLLYRVNPVFGFVEPGQNVSIDVLRHNGVEKTDHLIVLTSDTTQEAQCAKAIFETDPARELTVVPLVAH
ncbi:hypothetical protein L3Y34_000062 [Caenorhabditis briggsae]|uniref:Major sperm protein n=1 Tax=Caenorhabditis briggsae TaxID=6238 RepID=A0AAE9D8D2_CAEBR|nr:hypothetical protein L3Y34_000062 [Caenorhabditis briggsae]